MSDPSDPLNALSPLDGRYHAKVARLRDLASEAALHRYRVRVECEWFIELSSEPGVDTLPALSIEAERAVRAIAEGFDTEAARAVQQTERTTNHDVKAVEYFVKDRIRAVDGLAPHVEFVHFACTSEDINNLAYALMLIETRDHAVLPAMDALTQAIADFAEATTNLPMLSRTHGQPASPTTLGKEMRNVCARLTRQRNQYATSPVLGKINGAVGNFNAHRAAFPDVDWPTLSARFLARLGVEANPLTTQIEPHDNLAEILHQLARFNRILIDLDQDVWAYIAIEYFKQRKVASETGSSTMPHKVNPIDFENSEGNLGVANALLEHMASKLQVSRWQRDLSDSTVLRNLGTALGHCVVAYQATLRGLGRLEVNRDRLAEDLDANWEVLGEAVQTVMRKHGIEEPYEQLKALTRGERLNEARYHELLAKLDLPPAERERLAALRPAHYVGYAGELARND